MNRPPRWLTALGLALLLTLLLVGLRTWAVTLTRSHLQQQASQTWSRLRNGQPLWVWRLREPGDVVAGRAFGPAKLQRAPQGLRVLAQGTAPIELGLPLAGAVDPADWPKLRLRGATDAPLRLDLVLRPRKDAPACLGGGTTTWPAGEFDRTLDLRQLRWRRSDGGNCPLPRAAAMLRLRFQLPIGSSLVLDEVTMASAGPAPSRLPPAFALDNASGLSSLLADPAANRVAAPLILLPTNASAEGLLRLRDALRQHWPAALIVAGSPAQRRMTRSLAVAPWVQAVACGLYLLALLGLARWPPRRRWAGWCEIAALLAGPLWLIAGMQWVGHAAPPAAIAFVAAMLYAAQAQWRQRPVDWRMWRGWRAAGPALLPIPIALLLVGLLGHGWQPPGTRAAVLYLLWALLQQWALLTVVLPRLRNLLPSTGAAVLLTALAFALLHTPNGHLMQLCLLAEFWWATHFARQRVLLPIALAHAASALIIQAGLAGGVLRSLEVSARFFL